MENIKMLLNDFGKSKKGVEMPTIGIIGDTHLPFELEGYLSHCVSIFDIYEVDVVVHIGDFLDQHALSYHEHDPNGMSAEHEAIAARPKVIEWVRAFPEALWVAGNHDDLPYRKARTHGLPSRYMADYPSILDVPCLKNWRYSEEHEVDGIIFRHGLGATGKYGHRNAAEKMNCNVVQGHSHTIAGIEFMASKNHRHWGMSVGCGVDRKAYAAHYGRHIVSKPFISCAIISDDVPMIFPMDLGSKFRR